MVNKIFSKIQLKIYFKKKEIIFLSTKFFSVSNFLHNRGLHFFL